MHGQEFLAFRCRLDQIKEQQQKSTYFMEADETSHAQKKLSSYLHIATKRFFFRCFHFVIVIARIRCHFVAYFFPTPFFSFFFCMDFPVKVNTNDNSAGAHKIYKNETKKTNGIKFSSAKKLMDYLSIEWQ